MARFLAPLVGVVIVGAVVAGQSTALDIGSRRELFVDRYLIDRLDGLTLTLHEPRLTAKEPGGIRGAYNTVIKDGDLYRRYYREVMASYTGEQYDGHPGEYTAYAESRDGIHWTKPSLGLFEIDGSWTNNAILAHDSPYSHNFSPFLDSRPGVAAGRRFKALAGIAASDGLVPFVSGDGIHWTKLQNTPVITADGFAFDSQNVSFWSETEQRYVCYFRTWRTSHGELRTISRTTSSDFIQWTAPVALDPNEPGEHLYTSQTHPYFRAPQIYIALPTRFQPDRGNSTDILFMTARGAGPYTRLFKEAFIRPGLDPANWGNRANYAALNVVPTGPAEMSIYVRDRRYVLRTDGFVSVHAGFDAGELVTKPFRFDGRALEINYATSAGGSLRLELQGADGTPIDGYRLEDCDEIVGDEIARTVTWDGRADVSTLAGEVVRLRATIREGDLFAICFTPSEAGDGL